MVNSVSFSQDSQYCLSCSDDQSVRVWSVSTGQQLHCFLGHKGRVLTAAFSPDGLYILSGSSDKTIRLWSIKKGSQVRLLNEHADEIVYVAFYPYGNNAISVSQDKTVRLWHIPDGLPIKSFYGLPGNITGVTLSPNCSTLATSHATTTFRRWDIDTGKQVHVSILDNALASHIDYCHKLDQCLCVARERYFNEQHFDVPTYQYGYYRVDERSPSKAYLWKPLSNSGNEFKVNAKDVTAAALSSDGQYVLLQTADGTGGVWTSNGQHKIVEHRNICADGSAAVFSPDSKYYIATETWFDDPEIQVRIDKFGFYEAPLLRNEYFGSRRPAPSCHLRIFSMPKGTETKTRYPIIHPDDYAQFRNLKYSPTGKYIYFSTPTINILDADSGEETCEYLRSTEDHHNISCIAFSEDGKYIACDTHSQKVSIWDTVIQQEATTFKVSDNDVNLSRLAISSNGKLIAVIFQELRGNMQNKLLIWDVELNQEILCESLRPGESLLLGFSSDATTLYHFANEYELILWKLD